RGVRGRPARAYRSNASSMVSVKSLSGLVATGRDRSSVIGVMITRLVPPLAGYPHPSTRQSWQRKRAPEEREHSDAEGGRRDECGRETGSKGHPPERQHSD